MHESIRRHLQCDITIKPIKVPTHNLSWIVCAIDVLLLLFYAIKFMICAWWMIEKKNLATK